ncbi:hypothetical protein BU17DRAFT_72752 [Hysterangium stoloniferum]|nr:hypothetical protein BU17DRAFT_72752 [Hysterangium stoloniferum]
MLRAVEFAHRLGTGSLAALDTWELQKWFDMKWRRDSRPNIIDRIAEQAAIRIRGCRPEDTVLTLHNITWSMPTTLQGMKEWTCTMSEGMFEQGSMLERFTYVYGLYMAAGWADGTETSEWCKNAVEETAEWMCKLRYHQYSQGARFLLNRRWVLSATRVALLRQNDLTLKRMKCSPVHLEKAGGPFGHQILTPEKFSKPIATQYRKNPAEFNKALRIRDDDNDSIIEGQGKSWQNGVRAHIIPQVSSEGEGSTNTTIIAVQPPSGAMDQDGEHGVTLTTGPVRSAGAGGHRQGRKASHVTRSGPNEKLVAAMGPQAKALHRHFGALHAVGTLHTENENYIIAVFTQTIWVPTLKVFTKDYMGAYTEVILKIPRIWDCFTWKGFLRFFEKTHNT